MEILEYIISTTAGPQNTGAHIARGTARAMLRDLEGETAKGLPKRICSSSDACYDVQMCRCPGKLHSSCSYLQARTA